MINLLKHGKLRITNARRLVLEEFLKAGHTALSSAEIEKKIEDLDIESQRQKKTWSNSLFCQVCAEYS